MANRNFQGRGLTGRVQAVAAALMALALVAGPGMAGAASGPETPQAFLARIYAPYLRGDQGAAPTGRRAPTIFDAHLTRLIRRDQAMAKGEVGALDGDPICDCQDFERLTDLSIAVQPAGPGHAGAVVRFHNGAEAVTLTYKLVAVRAGWRVADVGGRDKPSLVALLEHGTARR